MRNVFCPGLGRDVSALGFGCAALGSQVSEAQGRRALDRAFEQGVTWYDTAPFYGDGEAEGLLGKFLAGRREKVVVCTQFGFQRPKPSSLTRLVSRLDRALCRAFPELRTLRAAKAPPRGRSDLRADEIELSIVESLRRLQTDYVDVVALPDADSGADQAILDAVHGVLDKGYARCAAISGTIAAVEATVRASTRIEIAQFVDNPFDVEARSLREALVNTSAFLVTHGVFRSGAYERVLRLLAGDGGRLASLASQLGYGPPYIASEMLLDYAFAENPYGVVLAGMFNPGHINQNCARAARAPRSDVAPFVQKFFVNA